MSDRLKELHSLLTDRGAAATFRRTDQRPGSVLPGCSELSVTVGARHLEVSQWDGSEDACVYTFPAVDGHPVTTDPDSPAAVWVDLPAAEAVRKVLRLHRAEIDAA